MTPSPQYLTPKELAVRLRVHPQTIRNWRKAGKLRPTINAGRVMRYDWTYVCRELSVTGASLHPAFEEVRP
jgi:predicted site-specific integrase-resolvase